jgi:heme O synthase-like polyprenyltransferase
MCSASASAFNQIYERKWDAMMYRTSKRPMVRGPSFAFCSLASCLLPLVASYLLSLLVYCFPLFSY